MTDALPGLNFASAPVDKRELLERISAARATLDEFVGSLMEQQITRGGGPDGWSVKDHLAHIATWEQKQVLEVEGRPDHECLEMDEATYRATDEAGKNRIIFERNRDRSVADVMAFFSQSHERMLSLIGRMSEDELQAQCHGGLPTCSPVIQRIAGNTYEHYMEHVPWAQAVIAQNRGPS